jgi:hypothetical protein
MVFNGLSLIGLLFSLAFFRYDLKKLGIPVASAILTLGYMEYSSIQTQKAETSRHARLVAYCKIQHATFVYRYSLLHRHTTVKAATVAAVADAPTYDFEVLANVVKRHENSTKFPYGCEYRGADGKLHGYPEAQARAKSIALCKRIYNKWVAGGCHGDFFVALNHTYAQDTQWHVDVEAKYNKAIAQVSGYDIASR